MGKKSTKSMLHPLDEPISEDCTKLYQSPNCLQQPVAACLVNTKNGLVVVEGDTPSDVMCDLCAESLNRIFTPKLPFSDLTQWQGQYSSLIHKRFFSRAKSSPIVAQANVYFH